MIYNIYRVPLTGAQEVVERMQEIGTRTQKIKKVTTIEQPDNQQNNPQTIVSKNNSTGEITANSAINNLNSNENQLPTRIKTEPIDDETIINAEMQRKDNRTSLESSSTSLAGQDRKNQELIDGSITNALLEHLGTVEDEKPAPGSYESVLMAFNASR